MCIPAGDPKVPVPPILISIQEEAICHPQDWIRQSPELGSTVFLPELATEFAKVKVSMLPEWGPIKTFFIVDGLSRKRWNIIIRKAWSKFYFYHYSKHTEKWQCINFFFAYSTTPSIQQAIQVGCPIINTTSLYPVNRGCTQLQHFSIEVYLKALLQSRDNQAHTWA